MSVPRYSAVIRAVIKARHVPMFNVTFSWRKPRCGKIDLIHAVFRLINYEISWSMCPEIDVVLLENTHYVDVVPHVKIERPYVLKI